MNHVLYDTLRHNKKSESVKSLAASQQRKKQIAADVELCYVGKLLNILKG
jgi:hypothetical protein